MDNSKKHLVDDAERVLAETKKHKNPKVEEANDIFLRWFYWASIFLGELDIPEQKIHYFTAAYVESTREVQSSIVLALHGSYKNAIQILRNWLELVVAGIYFDNHTNEGKGWEERGYNIRLTKFTKSLSRSKRLLSLDTAADVRKVWERLSTYVHSHAGVLESFSAKTGYGAIAPEYNPEYFDKWFSFLKQTNMLCSILVAEHIPKVMESESIKEIFAPAMIEQIKCRIADR